VNNLCSAAEQIARTLGLLPLAGDMPQMTMGQLVGRIADHYQTLVPKPKPKKKRKSEMATVNGRTFPLEIIAPTMEGPAPKKAHNHSGEISFDFNELGLTLIQSFSDCRGKIEVFIDNDHFVINLLRPSGELMISALKYYSSPERYATNIRYNQHIFDSDPGMAAKKLFIDLIGLDENLFAAVAAGKIAQHEEFIREFVNTGIVCQLPSITAERS